MEVSLKSFIAESLKEIIDGVKEAQEYVSTFENTKRGAFFVGDSHYKKVEFDISVTTSQTSDTSGKAGLMIKVIDFGVKTTDANSTSAVNRIKFEIPVSFPEKGNYIGEKYPIV